MKDNDGELYCDSCGEGNDGYPSEPLDSPYHCASRDECLEATDLGDYGLAPDFDPLYGAESQKIGALLNSELTPEGVRYLQEMLDEPDPTPFQQALHNCWREAFSDYLSTDDEEEELA